MTGTQNTSKQNFLLFRPSWISQSAINYTNLCRLLQILQTVPNILVYDTSCKKKRFDSLKFWLHRETLKMNIWEQKITKILHILGLFPWKFLFLLRNHLHSLEYLQKNGLYHSRYWIELIYLEHKTKFSFSRPSWTPSWIPQLAISYASLCRQFQELQAMPNILVYDTSCSTGEGGAGGGGSVLPLVEIVWFF